MGRRDQDVHFLASKEEVQRIHEKMDELGIRSMGAYAKRANETGNIYESDIRDLQERLEEIWTDMKEVLVCLSSIQ